MERAGNLFTLLCPVVSCGAVGLQHPNWGPCPGWVMDTSEENIWAGGC